MHKVIDWEIIGFSNTGFICSVLNIEYKYKCIIPTGFDSIDNIKLQVSFYDSDTYDTLIDDGVVQDINLSDSYTPFSISSVPGAVALDSSNGINAVKRLKWNHQ